MKKTFTLLVCLCLVAALLAGCSSNAANTAASASVAQTATAPTQASTAAASQTASAATTASQVKNADHPLRIVTMTDTEGGVIGQMMVQALKAAGYTVDDQTQSASSTELIRSAAVEKQADITLNYTGNGMYISGTDGDKVWTDMQKGYEKIKVYDLQKNNLVWLTPAKANNTELLAVTKEFAQKNNITDMYSLAAYINKGGKITVSCPAYWLQHNFGLLGLEAAYGFKLPESQVVVSDDRIANMKAVAAGSTDVNCTMIFTTDGVLDELGLYVVKDPLSIPPVYAPCAIVAKDILDKYPDIETTLAPVFASLDNDTLIALNAKVQSQGQAPADVAKSFLQEKAIIK
jgi:osmoprotectant transport system substrate-binding protein